MLLPQIHRRCALAVEQLARGAGQDAGAAVVWAAVADDANVAVLLARQCSQAGAIARSGGEPLRLYPGLTSFKEQGIDAEYTLWSALYAPAATPADVQEKLRATLRTIFADADFQKNAAAAGLEPKLLQGAELGAFHEKETAATNTLVQFIGKI